MSLKVVLRRCVWPCLDDPAALFIRQTTFDNLASAKKEEHDEREGHAAGPSTGGSTRAGGAPDNGETAAFMQQLAGNGADDDDSAEGSRTPHDMSREEPQNEDDTSMQDLVDDPDGDFDTQAADKNLERIIAELGIARI
ncbi:hypothetical protein KC333_g6752 [Hortaea werneckii]|nr:hypothetical protein KC333_g6752 [Hortaea werneckii]KAI7310524.1 hypothetical protein KC326_g6655 [Hortaea werneckii]